MILSLACIILTGMLFGGICRRLRLPPLVGMVAAGILLGPHALDLIDPSILGISADLRKIALIIILLRAGLKLSLEDLKKVGRPALLMCFLPALFEMTGMVLLAPPLLGMTLLEAAILGSVIAAVSPAVVVPGMIKVIDQGYGTEKGIPQMILAGASVDDVFVIVVFTTFMGLAQGRAVSAARFAAVPVSILTGAAAGFLLGYLLLFLFRRLHMRDTAKVLMILSVSFILTALEERLPAAFPFAGLIAVMSLGLALRRGRKDLAVRLSSKYDKLWVGAEVFLFVLVGASVAIKSALDTGPRMILLLLLVLVFRMAGVWLCLLGTVLGRKERLFAMLAYTPKATVQAAIGGIPLAAGLACGETVLTVSVAAILLTAPFGALAIDLTYRRFLEKEQEAGKASG